MTKKYLEADLTDLILQIFMCLTREDGVKNHYKVYCIDHHSAYSGEVGFSSPYISILTKINASHTGGGTTAHFKVASSGIIFYTATEAQTSL